MGATMPDGIPTRSAGDVPAAPITDRHEHYDAFISYSHAADGSLAPALQYGLQTLAKPLFQRKALRVFRDQTNLAATPELWPTIEQALCGIGAGVQSRRPAAVRTRHPGRSPHMGHGAADADRVTASTAADQRQRGSSRGRRRVRPPDVDGPRRRGQPLARRAIRVSHPMDAVPSDLDQVRVRLGGPHLDTRGMAAIRRDFPACGSIVPPLILSSSNSRSSSFP
jgi:hypothetical protein